MGGLMGLCVPKHTCCLYCVCTYIHTYYVDRYVHTHRLVSWLRGGSKYIFHLLTMFAYILLCKT